jgi:hypothetical protein
MIARHGAAAVNDQPQGHRWPVICCLGRLLAHLDAKYDMTVASVGPDETALRMGFQADPRHFVGCGQAARLSRFMERE